MKLKYTQIDTWPPLAWLAKCSISQPTVDVFHGGRVETSEEWFCEAIWDSNYEAGDFDQTDIVFGSGGRLRGECVTFVSAGTTVDRLQSLQTQENLWISNSLACLLATINGTLDPYYAEYY